MQEGVARSDRTIVVLSEAYLESVYGTAEWLAAWRDDPTGEKRKVLVVRVSDCERRGLLADVVGVADLFDRPEAEVKALLRRKIAEALAGRAKPEQAPPFPQPEQAKTRAVPREARFPGALPPVWNAPARNPNFTGRAEDLARLGRGFVGGRTLTVHALHGMGGVGKTQLAIEYAHVNAGNYEAVWWINSEEPTLVVEQLARLAAKLGIEPPSGEAEVVREALHEGLARTAGWLLIFDNAETIDVVNDWRPSAAPGVGIPGHVLVTTRREGFDAIGPVVNVDLLDLAESVQLLRTRTPAIEEGVARELAEELGRLPLALEQAAAYLNKTHLPAKTYLDLLRTRGQDLLDQGTVADRRDKATIATLWDLSLQELTRQEPAAVQLLDMCAYLAPLPIPEDLFTGHPDLLDDPLGAACGDPVRFNAVVGAVVDYSLAKRTTDGLLLHRLVQAAIRNRHAQPPPQRNPAGR
jgi:hypothetical protein